MGILFEYLHIISGAFLTNMVDIAILCSKIAAFLLSRRGGEMADEIDLANDLMDSELSRALNKIRQSASSEAKGSEYCIECGDDIPKERQKLGFKLCVPCASESERKKSLYSDEY
jgi:RNA polymerase-binding transcription factor DksA